MADDIWSKSNFASFKNTSLRITLHEPSYVQGEAILRWGWLLSTILVVFSWVKLPCVENEGSGDGMVFPGYLSISGCLTLTRHRTGEARRDGAVTGHRFGPSQLQRNDEDERIIQSICNRDLSLCTSLVHLSIRNDPITHSFGFGRRDPGCLSRLLCTRRWCLFDRPFQRVWGFTRRWFVR